MPYKQDWDKLVENFKKVAKDPGLLKLLLAEAKVSDQEKVIVKSLTACDKCVAELGKAVDSNKVDAFRKAVEPYRKAKKIYEVAMTNEIDRLKSKGQHKEVFADFYRGLKIMKTGMEAIEANIDNTYNTYFGILDKKRGAQENVDSLTRDTGKSLKSALAKALAQIQALKGELTVVNYNKLNGANATSPGRIVHAQLNMVGRAIDKGVTAPDPAALMQRLHPYAVVGELKCVMQATNNPKTDQVEVAKNIKEVSGLVKEVATTYAELLKG